MVDTEKFVEKMQKIVTFVKKMKKSKFVEFWKKKMKKSKFVEFWKKNEKIKNCWILKKNEKIKKQAKKDIKTGQNKPKMLKFKISRGYITLFLKTSKKLSLLWKKRKNQKLFEKKMKKSKIVWKKKRRSTFFQKVV